MSFHVIKHHAVWCCHVLQHRAMSSLIASASLSSGEPCFRAVCGTIPVASPNLNYNKLSSALHVLLSAFNTLQRHLLEGLTLTLPVIYFEHYRTARTCARILPTFKQKHAGDTLS